jgi:hypothetical protein
MKLMKTPIRIKLTDIVGSNLCVSSEDGGAVYEKLVAALKEERPIELDFAGVDMVISAFLNAAIGRLAEHMNIPEIHERITFLNSNEDDRDLMDRVLENAVSFYEAPDQFRKALEIDKDDEE